MNTHHGNIRRIYAWALLLALGLQRIVGPVANEEIVVLDIPFEMNKTEKIIAHKLGDELGSELSIAILDTRDRDVLTYMGYSAPFVFSETVDEEVRYFTINENPKTLLLQDKGNQSDIPDNCPMQSQRAAKDRLFSDFYFNYPEIPSFDYPNFAIRESTVPDFWKEPFIAISSPPPRSVIS